MSAPLLVMLAGPNGAGKTTFYEAHLKQLGLPFLNADVLAQATGLNAYSAAQTIAAIRDQWIEKKGASSPKPCSPIPWARRLEYW